MIAAPGWVGEDGGQRLTQRVVGPAEGATSARRELLAIQKRLWRRLVREIEGSLDASPPNVDIYQEEYERDVRRYEAISSKAELVEACAAADVVYVGDYHSLPQSQQPLVKLLLGVAKTRPEVVLCMELVDAERQDALDRFMDDRIDEERFLRELDYERTWGFPWAPYRDAFEVARRHGIRVLGINSDPRDHEHDQRDLPEGYAELHVVGRHLAPRPRQQGYQQQAGEHRPREVGDPVQQTHVPHQGVMGCSEQGVQGISPSQCW